MIEGREHQILDPYTVESALADHLGTDENNDESPLQALFATALGNDTLKVTVQTLGDPSIPAILTQPEFSKRMQEMAAAMSQRGGTRSMPMFEDYTLVVNAASPIVQNLKAMTDDATKAELVNQVCRYVYDLALIGQRPLTGEQMNDFISRSNQLLGQLLK